MKHSKALTGAAAALAMLLMIFDSKTALAGAAAGVQRCISTVIPSLFPFFILAALLTGSLAGQNFAPLEILGKSLSIPQGSASLLLVGLLGGYPVGAQCIAQSCREGQLSTQDGERMLAFCSNAGPAFLFGIGATLFPSIWICWLLWIIHIAAAWIVALLTPKTPRSSFRAARSAPVTLTDAMHRCLRSMALVCGWIVLFRTLIAFAERWFFWLLPSQWQLLITGVLELTNGCCNLISLSNIGSRMQLFSLLLGFGGLCVLLQTKSVLRGSGLQGYAYFPGKAAQSAISFLLCLPAQFLFPLEDRFVPGMVPILLAAAICAVYPFYCRKNKNSTGIAASLGV